MLIPLILINKGKKKNQRESEREIVREEGIKYGVLPILIFICLEGLSRQEAVAGLICRDRTDDELFYFPHSTVVREM